METRLNKHAVFKKGDNVKVIEDGNNASQFNEVNYGLTGIYENKSWASDIFEIEGTVKLVTFNHDKNIYGAYMLKFSGEKVGYVYNNALELYNEPEKTI